MSEAQDARTGRTREVEAELSRIWSEMLAIPDSTIDPDANFFSLGGDSVLIVAVADQVTSRFFADRPDEAPGIAEFFSHGTLRSLAARVASSLASPGAPQVRPLSASDSAIAIVGMACRFPGAQTIDSFWRNLRDGVESLRTFSDRELLDAGVSEADLQHPRYVKAGALLEGVRLFDADYFGMSPREAMLTSPEQRLVLECAEEAMQDGGHGNCARSARVGVFVGTGLSSFLLDVLVADPASLESSHGMALFAWNTSAASRVSYLLDLVGPSFTLDTACSSSLVAVHEACQSILRGECEMALAGGATVRRFAPRGYVAEPDGIFSPDGHCRPFDRQAQGTVSSSGAGMVLLMPLTQALAAGHCIYAVIRGTAINNDGRAKVGFTAPSAVGQANVVRAALAAAHVNPDTIAYLETHGTATPLGDEIELSALREVFGARVSQGRRLALGALKANLGHTEAAAGIAGLIKAALVLKHRQMPPAVHFREWGSPTGKQLFEVSSHLRELSSSGDPLRAGVSSFGIGGTNAHAVLEEAPAGSTGASTRDTHLLVLSARTETALREMARRLAVRIKENTSGGLADIAYTLQVGRKQLSHRLHAVASDTNEAIRALESACSGNMSGPLQDPSLPVVFMFPDRDAPLPSTFRHLCDNEPQFRMHLQECSKVLRPLIKQDLLQLLRLPGSELQQSEWLVPLLFAVEYSLAQLWKSWGVAPSMLVGCGLGEYVAACMAGLLTLERALDLVLAGESSHLLRSVSWGEIRKAPAGLFIEVGPGSVLSQRLHSESRERAGAVVASLSCEGAESDEHCALMRAVGYAWQRGVDVDWTAFNASQTLRRVALPAYPFERSEHWPTFRREELPKATETNEARLELSDWFNVPVWEERPALQPSHLPEVSAAGTSGCWLIFGTSKAMEAALGDRLTSNGVRVIHADRGSPESIARLFESLEREGTRIVTVVHGMEASGVSNIDESPNATSLYSLLDLCTAFASLRHRPAELIVVTQGAYAVVESAMSSPARAMLAVAAEVVGKEFPDIACRTIDIDPGCASGALEALSRELFATSPDRLVVLRGARRWTRTYRAVRLSAKDSESPLLRSGGAYLITGGLGGIGWTLAKFLARSFGARLMLVGRSSLPDRADEIRSLEAAGARVLVASADVASVEAMQGVVAQAVREFGSLDGVIHAAGVAGTGALHRKGHESVATVLAPKVMGTWAVHQACKSQDLDFFLCCSSLASVMTPAGWYEYSAANAYHDAFCEAHDGRTHTRFVAVGWDRWVDVGMAVNVPLNDSMAGMSALEGVEVFRRVLWNPGARWIVSTRSLNRCLDREAAETRDESPLDLRGDTGNASHEDEPSLTSIETELAGIWQGLLGVETFPKDADFLSLGGDSLMVVDLQTQIEARYGQSPSLHELLVEPTLGAMARRVRETL